MVSEPTHRPRWTLDEYLEMEDRSLIKHEFVDGYVYATSGGSQRHSMLGVRIARLLDEHLRDSPCRAFNSDMKVRLPSGPSDHLYPDASVSCDERDLANDEAVSIRFPCLVVEVLSRSTEDYDQGSKFALYKGCPTLEEYVLIATREARVAVYQRNGDFWAARTYGPGDSVALTSIDLSFPIFILYEGTALSGAARLG